MEEMEVRHYLTFEFSGIPDKFVYTVSEDVKNGVQQELLHRNCEIDGPVIEFDESSGRKIAVNAEYIRRCQALFDAGIYPPKDEDESRPDMIIVIEGMSKPLYYNDIGPEDAALVASVMAGVDSSACNFVSFTKCHETFFVFIRGVLWIVFSQSSRLCAFAITLKVFANFSPGFALKPWDCQCVFVLRQP
ncbi:MAG: hypothetical protein ABR568_22890 [Pyrinomonadaceae bacterium]